MIKANTIQFEQVEAAFHKWAQIYCNKQFDYWELINSAWLEGGVRRMPQSKIKYAPARIRWDMIDYMRGILKYRMYERRQTGKRWKHFPFMNFISDITFSSQVEDGDGFETTLIAKNDDLEQKDLINYLVNHPSLSNEEQLLMKSMYLDGCTQADVSKAIGLTESRISQIHANVIERLKALNPLKLVG